MFVGIEQSDKGLWDAEFDVDFDPRQSGIPGCRDWLEAHGIVLTLADRKQTKAWYVAKVLDVMADARQTLHTSAKKTKVCCARGRIKGAGCTCFNWLLVKSLSTD